MILSVAAPDSFEALTVYPLLTDVTCPPRYVSPAAALEQGATVTELPDRARLDELVVHNPLPSPIIVYAGQEVLGGRHMRLSPQAAHPGLRRISNLGAPNRRCVSQAVQHLVWQDVAAVIRRHGVRSPSRALSDVHRSHRRRLQAFTRALPLRDCEVGALVAIGGRFVVLDHVSDPRTWLRLKNTLVQGYALDAPGMSPASLTDATDLVALMAEAARLRGPALGLGETVHFDAGRIAGAGVIHDGVTVALTAFGRDPLPRM